jgi:hypothetical protein
VSQCGAETALARESGAVLGSSSGISESDSLVLLYDRVKKARNSRLVEVASSHCIPRSRFAIALMTSEVIGAEWRHRHEH